MDAFRGSGINSQNRGCVLLSIIPYLNNIRHNTKYSIWLRRNYPKSQ